jgi:DNA helicase HerA-like ATPase
LDNAQDPFGTVQGDDRVTIFGTSGSGKTEFAKRLLYGRVFDGIIVDTKLNEDWSALPTVKGADIYQIIAGARRGLYHWATPETFVTDEMEREKFFSTVYRAGSRTIYVDELLDVAPNANSFPDALKVIATRGRSAKVGLWTTTQRPKDIPLFAFSEAKHMYVFTLNLKGDRQRVEELCERQIPWHLINVDNHGFFYVDSRRRLHGPYKLKLH